MHISRRTLISIFIFLFVSGIGAYWTHIGQSLDRNKQRFFMSELVNAQASAIERRLERSLSSTRILAQGVHQYHGMIPDFETYANEVLNAVGGVSNLQLAPAGVIRAIHPLKGNEKAIGHNIFKDDMRLKEAMLAIGERRLTLAGPFELIQGGIGIIGRNPIYFSDENGQQFWGFASALIYLQDLLKVTELDSLKERGYSYQLKRLHPDSGKSVMFAGSDSPLTEDTYKVAINIPNGFWELIISRSESIPIWYSSIGYIVSILSALLIAGITNYVLHQPEKLTLIVNEKTAELEQLAYHDHLTGLANRRYLSTRLNKILQKYSRYKKSAVLMYLDLDDFKKVNDSMGHDAGDTLLREIADRLKSCVRSNDMVCRLGGDEFGILLLDTESISDVSRIAKKLIAKIEQPVILGNQSIDISTSIGITVIPEDGDNVTSILRNADMAMYSAKKAGKRSFCFYDESLQRKAVARLKLEHDLCVAITNEQFVLHYQPIISLQTQELTGYEALIRWQHPLKGLLYPDAFIGVAEETSKIIKIGYWVIKEACLQIKQNELNSMPHYRFSINLSPKQFMDPFLLNNIRNIVRDTQIDPQLLEFEITESCIMENVDNTIATLAQFKLMGISVSIDDFGTGYSSFALLKKLPVDKLKIDKSFVDDLETDRNDQKIVHGLISMAHKLHLVVVAEGIETEAQQQLLKSYQCNLGQGYLFSKPLPMNQQPHLICNPERGVLSYEI